MGAMGTDGSKLGIFLKVLKVFKVLALLKFYFLTLQYFRLYGVVLS